MTLRLKFTMLVALSMIFPYLAADQPPTGKNETKKHASGTMLFEPSAYEKVVVVLTKGKEWKYYQFTPDKPLLLDVEGTTVLYFRARLLYDSTMKGDQNFTLSFGEQGLLGMKSDLLFYSFKAKKSSVSTMKNEPRLIPSAAHEFKVTIPNGKHGYVISLKGTSAHGALLRILIRKRDLHSEESSG